MPLTTLIKDMSFTGIRQVLMGNAHALTRENFKTNQQELNVNSELVPGLKVLLRPWIPYSSKNRGFPWAQSNTP